MKHLIFKIDGQSLVRLDSFKPATDSVEYLTVSFEFPSDWSGTTKKANFRKDDKIYPALVKSDNTCIVPYEVLVRDTAKGTLSKQYFYMSVEGVNGTRKITTDEVKIEIIPSGTGEVTTPSTPTPDVFAQYVDDVKAQTKANSDSAQQSAENAEASAQSAEESANSLKNDYSNALKGYASGSVVRVDDVSPVEHYPRVKVHGKNLFKYGTLNFTKNQVIVLDEPLPVGTYTISALITSSDTDGESSSVSVNNGYEVLKYIPLRRNERVSSTFTVTKPITKLDFCAGYNYNQGTDDTATWADIQIEKGETATEYTPYIDPSTVTVTRCGKNIYNVVAKTQTLNGVTFTVNADGSVTANGTATKATFIGLGTVSINVGEKYRLSGSPSGSAFDTYMLYIHNNTTGADIYDLGSGKVFTGGEGELGLTIAVYANVTVNNLVFRPMVVYGEDVESFEPYTGSEYTPDADGTVEGVTSLAPTMTLLTDTEDVIVEVEYNRDLNVVISDILSRLNS